MTAAVVNAPRSSTWSAWITYAIASGACAALNGVFAKLTTTQLTSTWATAIASQIGSSDGEALLSIQMVEYLVRGFFLAMNIAFNGVMWGLFTRALTLANSTVRVSVINTSANFVITAILGALMFGESLPGLWWLGATMLVAGSVIIGRREESAAPDTVSSKEVKQARTVSSASSVRHTSSCITSIDFTDNDKAQYQDSDLQGVRQRKR